MVYKQLRKFDQALLYLRLLLASPPRPLSKSDIMFQIGQVSEAQGNINAAKDAYEQALQVDPKHAKVSF